MRIVEQWGIMAFLVFGVWRRNAMAALLVADVNAE